MPVKIHALPMSMNAVGAAILAADAECGGLEMCASATPLLTAPPLPHHR